MTHTYKIVLVLLVSLLLAGCMSGDKEISETQTPQQDTTTNELTSDETEQQPDENISNNEDTSKDEIVTDEEEVVDNEANQTEQQNELVSQGTFVGLVDNSSVEMIVEGEATIFRFEASLLEAVSQIAEGTDVSFTYHVNENNQYVIDSIK
ncbi:hypothetical protein EJF36_07755 [Bacillus sp. HMF5848]|uniref:hypothetical protein n=1 Tax=Bacillus sp. HMF5848 TaxID=2495421 RepID=UPI000F7A0B08|nr:hypothetical protein [Bacillus sp. HMF5848]RSK26763.1 hypothetical protein EJF36_07755 [Bacillus sp. HMF5848]